MHLDDGSIFGEFAGEPISGIFDQLASVLLLRVNGLALCLFLIEIAAFPWWFGWFPGGSGGAFEFVDAFGVEGIGDTLPIAFADSAIGLALLLHSNYNSEGEGGGIRSFAPS